MLIVNPAFGRSMSEGEQRAGAPVDWETDPIVLFSNSKPNAEPLLEGIRANLGAFRTTDNIDSVHKDSASQPAPAELIEQVAQNYRAALLAIGD